MTNPNKVETSVRLETYQKGVQLQKRAQAILSRVANYRRFVTHEFESLPHDQQPKLKVIYTFDHNGLDPQMMACVAKFDKLANEITQFLVAKSDDWKTVLAEETRISGMFKHFRIMIIATTQERELQLIKDSVPLSINTRVRDFVSDETFLGELHIKLDD